MKKFLLATVGLIALSMSAPASAADIAARPYTKAPPMIVAVYDWSGFYTGANGGWGSARNCWDLLLPPSPALGEGCHDATGGTAGGQVGYRWQAGAYVFGLEAQGNWADFKGSNGTLPPPTGIFTNETKIDAFGLFTGQVGYAWNNALLYVRGGGAVTSNRYNQYFTATGALSSSSGDETRWGGVVGVGLEYGFASNWSAAVAYDHMFMQDKTVTLTTPIGAFPTSERVSQNVDLVTVRVNYRWGGPVAAKY